MRRIIIFQNTSLLTQDTSQFIFCSNALDYDDKMYSPFYVYSDSMMTSSNGTIFRFTCPLWGEPPLTGGFPSQRPVTRSFDVLFDLRLNKRLSKQSGRRWFETPSYPLWRHWLARCLCCLLKKYNTRRRSDSLTRRSGSLIGHYGAPIQNKDIALTV